jgi:hypothetical protein
MNESSSSSPTQSTPLRTLEEILHNRIKQKKGEMHKSDNRSLTDKLWTEIETLQWVLAQILTMLRRSASPEQEFRVVLFSADSYNLL